MTTHAMSFAFPNRHLSIAIIAVLSCHLAQTAIGQDSVPPQLTQDSASNDEDPGKESQETKIQATKSDGKKSADSAEDRWIPLLPKKGMGDWEITDFGEKGKVSFDSDKLIIEMGDPLNGINYTKNDFPTDKYEIYVEANRLEGSDFLCGLTFPIQDKYCSLIVGGWGGGLIGLSSVDGFDASENSTTTYHEIENNKWYTFRVRVDPEYIRVWIDGDEFLRQEREGHEFSTRIEVYSSRPVGYCTFQSKVAIREFKWRPIFGIDPDAESDSESEEGSK